MKNVALDRTVDVLEINTIHFLTTRNTLRPICTNQYSVFSTQ